MVDLNDLQCILDVETKEYICLSCFAQGKENSTGHKASNRYQIIQNLGSKFFCRTWSLKEDLLLLQGLKLAGFGNWTDVAKTVTSKSAFECEERYMKVVWSANNSVLVQNQREAS